MIVTVLALAAATAVLCAFVAASVAAFRSAPIGAAFAAGALIGPLGIMVAFLQPPRPAVEAPAREPDAPRELTPSEAGTMFAVLGLFFGGLALATAFAALGRVERVAATPATSIYAPSAAERAEIERLADEAIRNAEAAALAGDADDKRAPER